MTVRVVNRRASVCLCIVCMSCEDIFERHANQSAYMLSRQTSFDASPREKVAA